MYIEEEAERNLAMLKDSKAGIATKEIARRFNVSTSTVINIVRRLRMAEETAERGMAKAAARNGSSYLPPRHGLLPTKPAPSGPGFGVFDVEPLDPIYAAYDASPFNGGKYPKGPQVNLSGVGSSGSMCVDVA